MSLPGLQVKAENPEESGHPISALSQHSAPYDKFHEGNTKEPKEHSEEDQACPRITGLAEQSSFGAVFC